AKVDGADKTFPAIDAAGTVELEFTRPTSRAYVQELVEREFRTARVVDNLFNITGTSDPEDGRYKKMKFDVSKNQAFDKLTSTKPEDAAEKAKQLARLGSILDGTKQ